MPRTIHPTAIVSPSAQLGEDVSVGPFCIVGDHVTLGDRVRLLSHAVVEGHTRLGDDTEVFPFASVGHRPQDLKYRGEASEVVIGRRCVIRENVTINPGTAAGTMVTSIGDDCLMMASAHVAHDCVVGDRVILANYVGLAGHVVVGSDVTFGGTCVIHQRVRIGPHAFIGAQSMIAGDVIPYGMAVGNRARLQGLNLIGLKRRGFSREGIHALRSAYRVLFGAPGTLAERVGLVEQQFASDSEVQNVVSFIREAGGRPLCLPEDLPRETAWAND